MIDLGDSRSKNASWGVGGAGSHGRLGLARQRESKLEGKYLQLQKEGGKLINSLVEGAKQDIEQQMLIGWWFVEGRRGFRWCRMTFVMEDALCYEISECGRGHGKIIL